MWSYAQHLRDRITHLKEAPDLQTIGAMVVSQGQILCAHSEACADHPGFSRAVYCMEVPPPLFDWFFNSWSGYRAAYFRSVSEGSAENTTLIREFTQTLVRMPGCDRLFDAETSLAAPSHKIWLAERNKNLCDLCEGEWSAPTGSGRVDIITARWECADHSYGQYGASAPRFKKIRVFGGFVDSHGREFVPAWKASRAQHLHDWGWS